MEEIDNQRGPVRWAYGKGIAVIRQVVRRFICILLLLAVCFAVSPQPARASGSDTAIIVGVTVGVVAVAVILVAILASRMKEDKHDDSFLLMPTRHQLPSKRQERVKFGASCAPDNGNLTVLCW